MQIELTEQQIAIIGMALCYVWHATQNGAPNDEMLTAAIAYEAEIPELLEHISSEHAKTGADLCNSNGTLQ